ncbi:MAG: DAK2 domain-containing protein [Pyramidobacter sp.]|jgi:dihydroxyacetone kinase-like protein
MEMQRAELLKRLVGAAQAVTKAEKELTEIDSHFGDADHGITMSKIAAAFREAAEASSGGIQEMLDDAATAVMKVNGGSAVPLWFSWLDGLQEEAPQGDSVSAEQLKAMFKNALESLEAMTKARVGDKTMMDALIPATEALLAAEGDCAQLLKAAATAAAQGAENSRNFVSKFGRARSYGEATLGTPDAGAVSMAHFFKGLAGA